MIDPRRKRKMTHREPEGLESRSMLAGHGFGAAFEHLAHNLANLDQGAGAPAFSLASFAANRSSETAAFQLNANGRSALSVQLSDDTGLVANVSFSTYTEDGTSESQLKIKVTGATANSSLAVTVDGTSVGTVDTDDNGAGTLVLSSNPDADEQQLPADLNIAAGTTVGVGTLSGTLAASTPSHGCGGGGEDNSNVTRLRGSLTDPNDAAAKATVVYKTHASDDSTGTSTTTTTLAVHVKGAAADTTLDVSVDDTVVGQVTTDDNGDAKVVFSSNPTGDQVAFTTVPTNVTADSTVTVGTLTGTLANAGHHGGRFRWR